jgi:ribosome-binding protein aMBF1 (putative translation factor)
MARKTVTKPIDDLVKSSGQAAAYETAAASAPVATEPERIAKKWTEGMARRFREKFAKNLRELRERAGLSLHSLADRAGVDHSQLVRLEAAERTCTLETAVKIGGALGVSLGILVDESAGGRPRR